MLTVSKLFVNLMYFYEKNKYIFQIKQLMGRVALSHSFALPFNE
jgi:hypothetical protein